MLVRLQCPACGKSLLLECNAATETLLCRACGTSFDPPPDCLLPAEPDADVIASAPPLARSSSRKAALVALAVVVVLAGGVIAAIHLRPHPPMGQAVVPGVPTTARTVSAVAGDSQAVSDQIIALKTDAEILLLAGDVAGSASKYRQIHQLLDGRDPADPVLKQVRAQVAEGERNVATILAARQRPEDGPLSQPSRQASGTPAASAPASDFGSMPPTAATPAASAPSDFTAPPSPSSPGASDFSEAPTIPGDVPNRVIPAAARAGLRGMGDAEVGRAIERGVQFLLTQFKDGEISPDTVLSDSQRQALDALCVYALAQSGMSINDSRLAPRGQLLPQMLDKLRAYDLNSDGKTTNRPITYGRSLRSAALASYDRPEDRDTLKGDVAWLIHNQIGGAYTYDDLYVQMMGQGMKPLEDGPPGPLPARGGSAPPSTQGRADFGGGSAPPPITPGEGPYVGGSPPSAPPSITGPVRTEGGGSSGSPVTVNLPPPTPRYPIQPVFRYVPPPFSRAYMGNNTPPPPPQKPGSGPPNMGGGSTIPPALNDGWKVPLPAPTFRYPWDNSNSQYGLLGVWAGAEVGMEVPDQYWKDVEHHWTRWQLGTGEWTYHAHEPQGYFAMTVAGAASLLVTHDYLDIPQLKGAVGREPYSNSLVAALAWLDRGDNSVLIPNANTHYLGYDLFGIERVGLASGFKYFGSHDWYRELAGKIVPLQFPNGAWGHEDHGNDAVVDTAYTLLFLARGRHPVMMTKLKFPGSWDNRPRDLANLARFTGRELERQVNWQVVGIEHDWQDYFDSPVLYLASHQAPHLKETDYLKLRSFVLAGGLIFTQADGSSPAFNAWVPELAKRIAPAYKFEPLPANSPIYNIQYKVASHPAMLGVSNGSRLLLVHCPADLSLAWQERSTKTRRWAFELGANVFIYASGKPDLRNRLESPFIPPAPATPSKTIRLAMLKYDGNWNPEPAAWFRMSRYLQWAGGPALDIRPLAVEEIGPGLCPIATLTGTDAQAFSPTETAALRAYVEAGGTLLIDSTGGENAFTRSIRDTLLPNAFGDGIEQPLPPDHPLFKDLTRGLANASPLRLRPYAIDRLGQLAPPIRLLKVGQGRVLFSPLDLTSGLLGTRTWGIAGYDPTSAEKFARNLLLGLVRS